MRELFWVKNRSLLDGFFSSLLGIHVDQVKALMTWLTEYFGGLGSTDLIYWILKSASFRPGMDALFQQLVKWCLSIGTSNEILAQFL